VIKIQNPKDFKKNDEVTMTYGLSMKTAFTENGASIKADDANKGVGPFLCDKCGINVVHVNASVHRYGDSEQITRHAYFRKAPSTPHRNNCDYIPKVVIEEYRRNSQEVSELIKERDDFYEVSLNIITERYKDIIKEGMKGADYRNKKAYAEAKAKGIKRANVQLSPYIKAASQIVMLWDRLEDDHSGSLLKLRLGNKNISWSSFYFKIGSFDKIPKLVWSTGKSQNSKYPIAIEFKVSEVAPDSKSIKGIAGAKIQTSTIVVPWLNIKNDQLLPTFKPNQTYLCIGYAHLGKTNGKFKSLSIDLYHENQITEHPSLS